MRILAVDWRTDRDDIHVLRGRSSRPLKNILWLLDSTTGQWIRATDSAAPPASISFQPVYPFTDARHGIEIDRATGVVTATHPLPAGARHVPNFLIYAEVTDTSVNPHPPPLRIPIRVHVHGLDGIARVHLAPSELTIRANAPWPGASFSVLVDFGDGTVGNLSRHPGLTWAFSPAGPPPHLDIDVVTGAIRATALGPSQVVEVTLPPELESHTARGIVSVAAPWSTPRTAHLLPDSAGANRIADVPNILFLPDGFLHGEEPLFKNLLTKLVDSIRKDRPTFPFGLLAGAMNFWYAFIDSPARGATISNLIHYWQETTGTLAAAPVHIPVPRDPATNIISNLFHVIHQVGLPIPSDADLSFSQKMGAWLLTYDIAHLAGMNEELFGHWRNRARYTLALDRNTTFGLTTGLPPQVLRHDFGDGMSWHPRRVQREHVDELLLNLRDASRQTIGGTWGSASGKDRAYVFFLSAGASAAGSHRPGPNEGVHSSLDDDPFSRVTLGSNTNLVSIEPHVIPAAPSWYLRTRVAHGAAHATHAGDEYGGYEPLQLAVNELGPCFNLQDATTAHDANGLLQPELMRWNWPRMSKVGVLLAPPVPLGFNRFMIEARGSVFAMNEEVRLRARPLSSFTAIGPKLQIVDRQRIGATVDRLIVTPLESWVPANWTAKNLIYAPKIEQGIELRLCSPLISQYIATEHNVMNRLATACSPDRNSKQALKKTAHTPPRPDLRGKKIRHESRLIGYWDGGKEVFCGIFHPAGACLMRTFRVPNDAKPRRGVQYRFCAVCRYIITDAVDPTKHPIVDADYKPAFYPI